MEENQNMNERIYHLGELAQVNGQVELQTQTKSAQQLVPEMVSTMVGKLPKNLLIRFLEFLEADRDRVSAPILSNLRQILENKESADGQLIEEFLSRYQISTCQVEIPLPGSITFVPRPSQSETPCGRFPNRHPGPFWHLGDS
jgi:hypothetical protein